MEQEAVEAVQKRQRLDRYAQHINDLLKFVQIDPVVKILSYLEADEMYYIMSQHPADRSFAEEHDDFWKKVALSKYGWDFKNYEKIFIGTSEAGAESEAVVDSVVPSGYKLNYLWMLLSLWGAKKLLSRTNDPFKTNSIEFSFNDDEVVFGIEFVSARYIDIAVKQNLNQVDLPFMFDALEEEFGAGSITSMYRSWRVNLTRNVNGNEPEKSLARLIYRLMLIKNMKIAQTYCLEEKRILLRERICNFYH